MGIHAIGLTTNSSRRPASSNHSRKRRLLKLYLLAISRVLPLPLTLSFYFSNDGGTTAVAFGSIQSGDTLYVSTATLGYTLDTSDRIDIKYVTIVIDT